MKSVGAQGHVSQLVAQRIVIAKIVKDYDHYKPKGMLNNRGGPAVVVGEGVVRVW